MSWPLGLSVDVDSVSSHLRGYGVGDNDDVRSAYESALPRLFDLLSAERLRMTFFLIGEEARQFPLRVRQIAELGHEVACHSMTHRLPFDLKTPVVKKLEIVDSKKLLEDITGREVHGFRAPSYDASPELFAALAEAGYRYDASLFPGWMLALLRRRIAALSPVQESPEREHAGHRERISFRNVLPHGLPQGLAEIPVATTPLLAVPYYHTFSYLLPSFCFRALGYAASFRRSPSSYLLHAADCLGLEEDQIDRRMIRHPGMSLPLAVKLDRLRSTLRELARRGSPVPLIELCGYFRSVDERGALH